MATETLIRLPPLFLTHSADSLVWSALLSRVAITLGELTGWLLRT
jgi:hypothetical protein